MMPTRSSSALRLATLDGDAAPGPRPKGSRRPHRNDTVAKVRKLIETTPLTYGEIAEKTGVGRASICRWTRDGGWQRHLFAPRATDTVPRERAGAQLKMRTLAARLATLAERYVRDLEETPGVDLQKLGEALALYKMAKLAAMPRHRPRKKRKMHTPFVPVQTGTQGPLPHELGPHATPALRMIAEMREAGVDLDYADEAAIKDYLESRRYQDLAARPRNLSHRKRREAWMREKE